MWLTVPGWIARIIEHSILVEGSSRQHYPEEGRNLIHISSDSAHQIACPSMFVMI